jgi:glycosyltransferase involved in cell wall biosynthesis
MIETNNMLPNKKNGEKWRLLYYGDLGAPTGFTTVSRNILQGLYKTGKFDISVVAINNWGEPIPEQKHYTIFPASNNGQSDPYGSPRLKNFLLNKNFKFDVFFALQDTFILAPYIESLLQNAKLNGKRFASIYYFPIDGIPRDSWVKAASSFDIPVTYTNFGFKECVKAYPPIEEKLSVIPHGVNPDHFFYIESRDYVKELRKKYFISIPDINEKFIFFRIDRNQQRKDYPRSFVAFKEFLKHRKDAILYCHCMVKDHGWDLAQVAKNVGLEIGKDIIFPENFNISSGFPVDMVNKLYNMVDCSISTAVGGGWELINVESFGTKTPIIAPNNTAFTEIIGAKEERGYLVDSGSDINLFNVMARDEEVMRPLVDINHMVEKMIHVYDNREEAAAKADVAYDWVMNKLQWQKHIVPMWIEIISAALNSLNGDTSSPRSDAATQNQVTNAYVI